MSAMEGWTRGLANRFGGIEGMTEEDLAQEVMLKLISNLHRYEGRNGSSFKTWACRLAKNHLCDIKRRASRRSLVLTEDGAPPEVAEAQDLDTRTTLRCLTKDLLSWLKKNPDGIECGWEVLNLLLKTHGNVEYVSYAMTLHTGMPWSRWKVRKVRAQIASTPRGLAMCQALGIKLKDEE